MNKTPILTGISHPPTAKPHVKSETVLYHQPILTSPTTVLPLELCPEHPDTLTNCGCILFSLSRLFCASRLSAVCCWRSEKHAHCSEGDHTYVLT